MKHQQKDKLTETTTQHRQKPENNSTNTQQKTPINEKPSI